MSLTSLKSPLYMSVCWRRQHFTSHNMTGFQTCYEYHENHDLTCTRPTDLMWPQKILSFFSLPVSKSGHASFCTVKVKHPSGVTISKLHICVDGRFNNGQRTNWAVKCAFKWDGAVARPRWRFSFCSFFSPSFISLVGQLAVSGRYFQCETVVLGERHGTGPYSKHPTPQHYCVLLNPAPVYHSGENLSMTALASQSAAVLFIYFSSSFSPVLSADLPWLSFHNR